jgi:outer membrane protein
MTNKFLAGAALIAMLAATTSVAAQTAAEPAVTQGPAIPGMCILSINQAISTSTVGQYVGNRMKEIVAQVKAELEPEDESIATAVRALQARRASLAAASFQTQADALNTRENALREKAQLRQREVQDTERKAINRIAQELDPVARSLYEQHRCSILVNKDSVMIANPQMDLTSAAVAGLNARIQQFAFEREHLEATPPAQ